MSPEQLPQSDSFPALVHGVTDTRRLELARAVMVANPLRVLSTGMGHQNSQAQYGSKTPRGDPKPEIAHKYFEPFDTDNITYDHSHHSELLRELALEHLHGQLFLSQ